MALDYASYNVRINSVSYGLVKTELSTDFLRAAQRNQEVWAGIVSRIPFGRVGRPEDLAYAAPFLVSDDASWITGPSIMLDGGFTTH